MSLKGSLARFSTQLGALLVLSCACAACSTTTTNGPVRWERRTLAPGVELNVSDEAGPDASAVADEVVRQYRERYVAAR